MSTTLLSTCEFVKRKENILLLGPPGVGKSHIAAGLGVKAAENGFAVVFLNADDLMELLLKDEAAEKWKNRRRRYINASLLIIDELGYQALDRHNTHLFFKVISQRYERGSIIITSNKGMREWPEILAGDEVLATAILDRLLHHCHVLQIDGRSYRLKKHRMGSERKRRKTFSEFMSFFRHGRRLRIVLELIGGRNSIHPLSDVSSPTRQVIPWPIALQQSRPPFHLVIKTIESLVENLRK